MHMYMAYILAIGLYICIIGNLIGELLLYFELVDYPILIGRF